MHRDTLRVLHLEPNDADHERVRSHAAGAGLSLWFHLARDRAQFEAALRRGEVDVILAEAAVPGFAAADALDLAKACLPGVPFIVVSRSIGEEAAVALVKRGANDFVHKDRLERLSGVVARARAEQELSPEPLGADLLHAQKMKFIGNLAGGVAHDFNNQLTVISGYVSLLLDRETLSPQASESLKKVFTASRQAVGLVRQLMLVSRRNTPKREVIDLNAELGPMVPVLQRLVGDAIAVEFTPSPAWPAVNADISMLEQALLNLALNARDAMPKGGRLDIALGVEAAGRGEGEAACIRVSDTGCGIPADVLPRIFEPFFTTKAQGKGTGLGLATVQDIVRRHDGWVRAESSPKEGATFRIYLPIVHAPVAGPPESGAAPATRAKAVILLVEDEAGVREFAAAFLQQEGYALLQAKSGEAALEIWRWHARRIDLLLTDVVLAGDLSGPQLAERLVAEKPSLRTVFATGYSKEVLGQQSALMTPLNVLNKPYTPRALLRAVKDALMQAATARG